VFGEPEVAVGATGDAERPARGGVVLGQRGRKCDLGEEAGWRDPTDLAGPFGEPEVTVRAGRDADWHGVVCGNGELRDSTRQVAALQHLDAWLSHQPETPGPRREGSPTQQPGPPGRPPADQPIPRG